MAGAAFQIEGAVKDEGRGPSIWDVLTHRVTDFVQDNFTADVTDNNYYMYKDGRFPMSAQSNGNGWTDSCQTSLG